MAAVRMACQARKTDFDEPGRMGCKPGDENALRIRSHIGQRAVKDGFKGQPVLADSDCHR